MEKNLRFSLENQCLFFPFYYNFNFLEIFVIVCYVQDVYTLVIRFVFLFQIFLIKLENQSIFCFYLPDEEKSFLIFAFCEAIRNCSKFVKILVKYWHICFTCNSTIIHWKLHSMSCNDCHTNFVKYSRILLFFVCVRERKCSFRKKILITCAVNRYWILYLKFC